MDSKTTTTTRTVSALFGAAWFPAVLIMGSVLLLNAQEASTPAVAAPAATEVAMPDGAPAGTENYTEPPLLDASGEVVPDESMEGEMPELSGTDDGMAEGMKPRMSLMEEQAAAMDSARAGDELPEKTELFRYAPGLNASYSATGQDVTRPSVVGMRASMDRERVRAPRDYNLKLGPFRFNFGAGVGFEFNDNINYASTNEQSDFIIRPHIMAQGAWDISSLNTLTFDIGLSYAKYVDHADYDTSALLITPGSQLSFDIYIGDFRINLHDRFSIQQDPIDEPAISGVADFLRFANTIGFSVLWDLNDVQLIAGYDHFTYISLKDEFSYLDRSADAVFFTASFNLRDTMTVGFESGAASTRYDEDYLDDSASYHFGLFLDTVLTPYMRLRVAAGYQGLSFDGNDSDVDSDSPNSWYANVSFIHNISPVARQTLIFGHETQLGTYSNYQEINFAQHTVVWDIIYHLTLQTDLRFEGIDESGGPQTESFQRYGAAVALSYPITEKLTASLRYQFLYKDSSVADRDYKQNQVLLDFNYTF